MDFPGDGDGNWYWLMLPLPAPERAELDAPYPSEAVEPFEWSEGNAGDGSTEREDEDDILGAAELPCSA